MRSVFAFLYDVSSVEIQKFVDSKNASQGFESGKPLYVEFWEDWESDSVIVEEGTHLKFKEKCGSEVSCVLSIGVSGRDDGTEEVYSYLGELLKNYKGFAMDDYTNHLWSLSEIQNNKRIDGHLFFDFEGWYDQEHTNS